MKKISLFFAAALTAAFSMTSCTSSTPKADLNNEIDSLSYAIGLANTQGLKDYLTRGMGVDTAYINAFMKGLNESVNSSDDKEAAAYYAGLQIGQQITNRIITGYNQELFGQDSSQTISMKNFMAGFGEGVTGKTTIMSAEEAVKYADANMPRIKKENLERAYAPNKIACEAYMDSISKKEGIKQLENGVYYEVLVEGKGEIPTAESKVKVHYEGKLIDGTIFDSSIQRNDPTTFRCNQVIAGWTNALTHMPVGSKWIVYIPQDQAYGDREAGTIKPFSALTFTIELLSIEK